MPLSPLPRSVKGGYLGGRTNPECGEGRKVRLPDQGSRGKGERPEEKREEEDAPGAVVLSYSRFLRPLGTEQLTTL